jgi:glycosyltransferase involved in cell wall biosynthesis
VLAPDIDPATADAVKGLGAVPVQVRLSRASLNPFGALATMRDVRARMRELRPKVVIAYTITPIVLGAAAARAAGAPRFVALVTGLGYAFTGGIQPKRLLSRAAAMLMYRRAFRRSSVAVFQNPDDRREFQRLRLLPRGLPTAIINGSGVDLERYAVAPLPPQLSFLMIARFLKDKGIREYGEAAIRLKREHPEISIRLVGWMDSSPDAIHPAELDRMIEGGVEMLGRMSDVRPAIANCSVYVLPSYREGTPRSVLEAMAMGRAIITTDAPGCRETVLEGSNGFLVEPRDADSLYRAMKRFADNPGYAEVMGAKSRELAEQKYDVHQVNRELMRHAGL